MDMSWPLVGRHEALRLVAESWRRTPTQAALVIGAAGVGKTCLAQQVATQAAADGHAVAWVTGTRSGSTIPFGAVASLLPSQPDGPWQPLELLRSAVAALVTPGQNGLPAVLIVDDAHLLDDASATVVHHVALQRAAHVLVTITSGAAAPDVIELLWKEELASSVELPPLTPTELDKLLTSVLGGPVSVVTRERMRRAARGDLALLREIVRRGVSEGTLRPIAGAWVLDGEVAVGGRLRDLIVDEIAGIGEKGRRALYALTLDQPLPLRVLDRLVGAPATRRLERDGIINVQRHGRRLSAALATPLYTDVLRAEQSPAAAREVARGLAVAVLATGARRHHDPVIVATGHLHGGWSSDGEQLTDAAWRASAEGDAWRAERLARAAIVESAGLGAHAALAEALRLRGEHDRCEEALAHVDGPETRDALRVRRDTVRARNLVLGLHRVGEAFAVLDGGYRSAATASARSSYEAELAVLSVHAESPQAALRWAHAVLRSPGAAASAVATAAWAATLAAELVGDPRRADSALDLWQPLPGSPDVVRRAVADVRMLRAQARWSQAEAAATSAYESAIATHHADAVAVAGAVRGSVLLTRGRIQSARTQLEQALTRLRVCDPDGLLHGCLADLVSACALSGDLPAARARLEEADRAAPPEGWVAATELHLARARVAAAQEGASRARALATTAADEALEKGRWSLVVQALLEVARWGAPRLAVERFWAREELLTTPVGSLAFLYAHALHAGVGADLDAAARRFAQAGALLLAAEAAAEAACRHRERGDRAAGLASDATARRWLAQCDGAGSLGSIVDRHRVVLTRREREIAELAAAGLESREIAARLVLSVRTVDNHLYRAYGKLGIGSRRELPASLSLLDVPT